jgi:hypothetical protein
LFAGSTAQSLAASHEWKGFTHQLGPGQLAEHDLSCARGELMSGGFSLDSTDGPRSRVIVVVNGPVPRDGSHNSWRVGVMNDHDASVTVNFRISILCS